MKRLVSFATLAGTVALAACADTPSTAPSTGEAPSLAVQAGPRAGDVIPDQYIVVFKETVTDAPGLARRLAAQEGSTIRHVYGSALKGFAGQMSAASAARLGRDPSVAYVEQDQVVTADVTQTGATWGIDRIDQADLPLSGSYSYTTDGAGVTAYIIDTGIQADHPEFGGRASILGDATGGNGVDCNGHGTHVAGTVGGSTWGVAKAVTIKAERVLDCNGSGSVSGVIAGINAVAADHGSGPAVANMSLGGGFSSALNAAVTNAINDGITFGVAAGNSNASACNYSPASTPAALTVGATTSSDAEASYSNYGSCVDILAPGSGITSAWLNSGTNTISGTSMATPHVVGAAARYLSNHTSASPAAVASFLTGNATANTITLKLVGHGRNTGPDGTPNRMLFLGSGQ